MTPPKRSQLEELENDRLAPYAIRSETAQRRLPLEDKKRAFDYRTHFQRDRDRVVYSRAFRRLRHKAQTGILPAYEDHRRNRLTHTLEVCQFARTMGRSLDLNEDLVETVAMAHDLGQPPFGPAGTRALHDWMRGRMDGHGGLGLGNLGGFDRATQSLRVVDRLEKRYAHPGLNLTDAVREGILKSGEAAAAEPGGDDSQREDGLRLGLAAPFEVQVVRLSDRICTALSDLDDALQSGSVEVAQVERMQAVKSLKQKLGTEYPNRGGRFVKANAIHRGLLHLLITGAVVHSRKQLTDWAEANGVQTAEGFLEVRDETVQGDEVGLSAAGGKLLVDIERFLGRAVGRTHEADQVNARGRRTLLGLFAAYYNDPTLLEDHVLFRYKDLGSVRYLRDVPVDRLGGELARKYWGRPEFARLLCDYLAGMTDPYALEEHGRLMQMGAVPIPGAEQLRRERPGKS